VVAGCAVDTAGIPAPDGSVATACSSDDECSDGVDCTDDLCGADGVCTYMEVDSRCADGEVCLGGTGCQPEGDCNETECADALRVALTCQVGACQPNFTCLSESTCGPGESCCGDGTCMDCDDGNPCTEDSCDAAAGGCVHMPLDGTPCDDGDFCTGTEVCVAGTCDSSGDPCTAPTVCDVDRCVGCRNDGDCPSDIVPPYGSCEWSDICDQRSVRRRTVTSFACESEECIGSDSEDVDNCPMRDTDGTTCAPDMVGSYTACGGYDDTCDETGTRSRQRTEYACASGSCDSSVSTESDNCNRDTDGTTCMPTVRPDWGDCGEFGDPCDQTGVERRTITVYQCDAGGCSGTDMNRMQDCTRNTDGAMDCGTPNPDELGPCTQNNPGTCDKVGSRTVTSYGTMCMDGGCVQVPSMRNEACAFETDGDSCGGGGTCGGECNDGSCDMNARDGTVCAGSGPCASECSGGSCDDTANDGATCGGMPCPGACSSGSCDLSDSDGDSCNDDISCTGDGSCSGGTCSMGSDTCVEGGSGDCGACTGGTSCACDVGADACACM